MSLILVHWSVDRLGGDAELNDDFPADGTEHLSTVLRYGRRSVRL